MLHESDTPEESGTEENYNANEELQSTEEIESVEQFDELTIGDDDDQETESAEEPDQADETEAEPEETAEASEIAGRLYIVGSPIANADDITMRARRTLEFADLVACEDYKVGARLLRNLNISKKLMEISEQNMDEASREVLALLTAGKKVVMLADAGVPLLADPDTGLMRRARTAGIEPVIIPGVSTVMMALLASGFSVERFEFFGFLPRKSEERKQTATELAEHSSTVAVLESPARMRSLLSALADAMPDRNAALVFNMTMASEAVIRGTLAELDERMSRKRVKGEFVLVLDHYKAPPPGTARAARSHEDRFEEQGTQRGGRRDQFVPGAPPRSISGPGQSTFRRGGPVRPERSSGFRRDGERPFEKRRDDRGERGFGPRRDDSERRPRRDDGERKPFGPRRDDGGGRRFDGQRDNNERKPFGPRRDDSGGRRFGGQRDNNERRGFGGGRGGNEERGYGRRQDRDDRFGSGERRNTEGRGGFGGPRKERGGDDRRRSDDRRGGGGFRDQRGERGTDDRRRDRDDRGYSDRGRGGSQAPRRERDNDNRKGNRRRNDNDDNGIE